MITLDISDYKGNFGHLNGKGQQFPFTRFDISRAFMSIGFPKLGTAIAQLGMYRFAELFFRSRAYLTLHNGNFQLKPVYYSLDPSEQRTISYFLGQAFTKLYAEKKLNCTWVDNVHNHKNIMSFNNTATTFTPKKQLYKTKKTAKEPDLIGFESNRDTHILEAKAYSSGFNGGEFQHAINQVSSINNVNGKPPATKTACFFDLSTNPFNGQIVDPDDEAKSIDIEFPIDTWIYNYYSMFNLEYLKRRTFWEFDTGKFQFAVFRVYFPFHPLIYFGVERNIFEQVNSEQKAIERFEIPTSQIEIDKDDIKEYSIGSDGIILLQTDRPTPMGRKIKKYWR